MNKIIRKMDELYNASMVKAISKSAEKLFNETII